MSEPLLQLDTHLYEQLDIAALQRSLAIQLPLVSSIGSLRASILGTHVYQFAVSNNCAAIDRVVLLLRQYRIDWPAQLGEEVHCCALLRSEGRGQEDWLTTYLTEAEHLLMVAASVSQTAAQVAEDLRQYQIYACAHLLGEQHRPNFLKLEEIEALLDPKTKKASALFARQFCERQRKPELLARELATHFSAFKP